MKSQVRRSLKVVGTCRRRLFAGVSTEKSQMDIERRTAFPGCLLVSGDAVIAVLLERSHMRIDRAPPRSHRPSESVVRNGDLQKRVRTVGNRHVAAFCVGISVLGIPTYFGAGEEKFGDRPGWLGWLIDTSDTYAICQWGR
jgi:hypothetical protein